MAENSMACNEKSFFGESNLVNNAVVKSGKDSSSSGKEFSS